jgi:hypothetical protein
MVCMKNGGTIRIQTMDMATMLDCSCGPILLYDSEEANRKELSSHFNQWTSSIRLHAQLYSQQDENVTQSFLRLLGQQCL